MAVETVIHEVPGKALRAVELRDALASMANEGEVMPRPVEIEIRGRRVQVGNLVAVEIRNGNLLLVCR